MTEARVRALMALARATKQVTQRDSRVTDETAVLAALTAWFASAAAVSATALPSELVRLLTGLGISREAAETAGRMATVARLSGRTRHGAPSRGDTVVREVASEEPQMRAQYLLAASKRLSDASDKDKAKKAEERYLEQHIQAGQNRRRAAREVDRIAQESPVMIWRTAGDDRVDARCRALEGRLFTADNLPGGQLPGAVHARCRCRAEPWGGGPNLNLNWGVS